MEPPAAKAVYLMAQLFTDIYTAFMGRFNGALYLPKQLVSAWCAAACMTLWLCLFCYCAAFTVLQQQPVMHILW